MTMTPIVRDVCLVGGGHSHALLLRRWAMHPLPGVRLTLVSSAVQTPYSGMLPGLIAGHYSYDDIHIDLLRLCAWADVRFIEDTMTGIDTANRQIYLQRRPALSFDVLSLDTGSTPDLSISGSAQHTTPVKPVSNFNARWQHIEKRFADNTEDPLSIGVVGSGAGGFELVTAMRHRLRHTSAQLVWFLRGNTAISGRAARVGELAMLAARKAGIEIVENFDVVRVAQGELIAADGRVAKLDDIIWCTAATGPEWPAAAGLDTDKRGFVATNAYLQSTSHPFVFATGDIGTQTKTPSNKAGVFAVRQAPVLFENIRALLLGQKLKPYAPQKDFLSLMATGPRHGIANRGRFVVHADWVWRWKDYIDQTFMEQFRQLPPRPMNATLDKLPDALIDIERDDSLHKPAMRCNGCGAKVGSDVLQKVLDDVLPAIHGDAAVVHLPSRQLVQSVDQINAIVDDPWLLGRIAALHAISDVITLDAQLHSAQVLVTLKEASDSVLERDLRLMMSGVVSALTDEGCDLMGGHTTQGPEMSIGLVVNATRRTDDDNAGSSGDAIILTKAIGIGTVFAALMQTGARGQDVMLAIESMTLSNKTAAEILRRHGSRAITDVTGFGLLGHLQRLLQGVQFQTAPSTETSGSPAAQLFLDQIPLLSGAHELSSEGYRSSLYTQNHAAVSSVQIDSDCDKATSALLVDPQTSGGLLALVPKGEQTLCVQALVDAGYADASVIGELNDKGTVTVHSSRETT